MTQDMLDEESRGRRISVCSTNSSSNSSASLVCREYGPAAGHLSPGRGFVSAPHSRSCSFRNKPRARDVELLGGRPRTNSMPDSSAICLSVSCENIQNRGNGLYRVRSFIKTSKGLVNRGDSLKKRSTNSVMSSGSTVTESDSNKENRGRALSVASQSSNGCSGSSSTTAPSYFRVVILGATGVGKTALKRQFMTSEYLGTVDNTCDSESENTVSVLLDGEESTMEWIDATDKQGFLEDLNVDGYVVVYSITDRSSFRVAVKLLHRLRNEMGTDRAIVVVANKIDLVRKREITADEARSVAINYDCKYIETSAVLNHQVDELLVGTLSQIRLKLNVGVPEMPPQSSYDKKVKKTKTNRNLLSKLFKKNSRKAKSCDNLFVL